MFWKKHLIFYQSNILNLLKSTKRGIDGMSINLAMAYNKRVFCFVPSALRPNPRFARTSDTRRALGKTTAVALMEDDKDVGSG